MGPIQVVVQDGNNLVLEVTPTPNTTVILDRGIAGPPGPTGTGDVDGPASATDNAVARFDGTTGKLIQNSVVLVGDTGAVSGVTDLTASGAVTLSGGTANGVAYLNGSKVLTTGSALTFDGSQLGVGTASGTSNGLKLNSGNAGANYVFYRDGTTGLLQLYGNQTGFNGLLVSGVDGQQYLSDPAKHIWSVSNTEQMRLTSTGLGIGTSSPWARLSLAMSNGQMGLASGNTSGGVKIQAWNASGNADGYLAFEGYTKEYARFDSSGNLGIGTSSPSQKLEVSGGAAQFNGGGIDSALGDAILFGNTTFATVQKNRIRSSISSSASSNLLSFETGTATVGTYNTHQLFLNGIGNVGIGTGSPTEKLTVNGNIKLGTSGTSHIYGPATTGRSFFANSDSTAYIGIYGSSYGSGLDSVISFVAGTSNSMTFNASGNLGLGVTPSAWGSSFKALQIGVGGNVASQTSARTIELTSNAYNNGGWKYTATDKASLYYQFDGAHAWATAPSGTAGNAISFTQAMTLDASGNLGVGTTSPVSGTRLTLDNPGFVQMLLRASGVNRISLYGDGGVSAVDAWANPLAFYAGSAERARIDSSGNFGIGTSSPSTYAGASGQLVVYGGVATTFTNNPANMTLVNNGTIAAGLGAGINFTANYNNSIATTYAVISGIRENATSGNASGALVFGTRTDGGGVNIEKARIDSSGNLLVGTTSASGNGERLNVTGSSTSFTAYVDNTSTGARRGIISTYSGSSPPNDTGNEFIYCNDLSAVRMTVRSNGGIANFSGNDVNLSDRREKTNFAPAKSYLDTICAIPVQTFNYIDQNLEEDGGLTLGVVAQDVQAVAPELVMESNWGTQDELKQRLSIYQTDLQYALMKCIQEQQTIITALTARVAALESN
jgi:hypothetical protein